MSIIGKAIDSWLNPPEQVQKASRGTLSSFVMGVPHAWGQPFPMVAADDATGLITPQRMREIVLKTPTAAACINTILDFGGGVKIDVHNLDPGKPPVQKNVKAVQNKLSRPNPEQTGRQFKLSYLRDLVTLGFAAIEIERDLSGQLVNLWVLDAARVRIDYDEHGHVLGYDMLDIRGKPIIDPDRPKGEHAWRPEDIIFLSLNPMSESVYPYSRISQLFTCAMVEDLMLFFISGRFTESNSPYGIYDLGDINEDELEVAITQWNTQAKNQHRILLTGSKGGSKFVPFGYHLKDLEATGLLNVVQTKIMNILGVTMNELQGSDAVKKSDGFNLSYTFKKRALEPMLNEVTETFTKRLVWEEMGFEDLGLYADEIDSRDELIQAQIDESYIKMGVVTINDVANRKGYINVEGGDDRHVSTGTSWIPVDMIRPLAESMIQAEQASGTGMSGPDSVDSARVKTQPKAANNSTGQKPQGTVHAIRSVTGSKQ